MQGKRGSVASVIGTGTSGLKRAITPAPSANVRIVQRKRSEIFPLEWDNFAVHCGSSFRCAFHALRAWQLDDCLRFKLRMFEIFDVDDGQKIGQCAVAFGTSKRFFVEDCNFAPDSSSGGKA